MEVERCKDIWPKEVQEEFRRGCFSEDNWNFLHGRPALVPGSCAAGRAQRGGEACQGLADAEAVPTGASAEAARQRARSFDVQRHRARVSLRANVKSARRSVSPRRQTTTTSGSRQRTSNQRRRSFRPTISSTNRTRLVRSSLQRERVLALCTLWQRISHRRMRFESALALPRRMSHGFSATTVEISMACFR